MTMEAPGPTRLETALETATATATVTATATALETETETATAREMVTATATATVTAMETEMVTAMEMVTEMGMEMVTAMGMEMVTEMEMETETETETEMEMEMEMETATASRRATPAIPTTPMRRPVAVISPAASTAGTSRVAAERPVGPAIALSWAANPGPGPLDPRRFFARCAFYTAASSSLTINIAEPSGRMSE
jgi:hypothetical protein